MEKSDLPAGLETGIRAWAAFPEEFERQGYPALRDWVMGVTADPPGDIAEWIEARGAVAAEASELLERLEAPVFAGGAFPDWWGCRWHQLLRQPWAEDAEWAVVSARVALDLG